MSETKNELEDLLEKAATEPAHRPAFFPYSTGIHRLGAWYGGAGRGSS
ncbi:Protein SseB [Escherichia coli ISC41]|nr:Protein SseB [Escherichia coli ISC41]